MAQRIKLDMAQIMAHPLVRKCAPEEQELEGPEAIAGREPAAPASPAPTNNLSQIRTRLRDQINNRRNTTTGSSPDSPLPDGASPGSFPATNSLARRRLSKRMSMSRSPETPVYEGLYNNTMASPRPKLKLPNFSISPYVESK